MLQAYMPKHITQIHLTTDPAAMLTTVTTSICVCGAGRRTPGGLALALTLTIRKAPSRIITRRIHDLTLVMMNAPSRAINGDTEDVCLQDPQYRSPCAQDYRPVASPPYDQEHLPVVDSPYQMSSHSSRVSNCVVDQSLCLQECPPVVDPSWPGSHMTGEHWNSQRPVDIPRPVIGRHSDRQLRDDFSNVGSHFDRQFRDDFSNVGHLDQQFRDDFSNVGSHFDQPFRDNFSNVGSHFDQQFCDDFSNVGNHFDRQRRDDFANGGSRFDRQIEGLPRLDIEGFFDRRLREEIGIELDLCEDF
jgi:hypothetical protein